MTIKTNLEELDSSLPNAQSSSDLSLIAFTLARYHLTLEAVETLHLPPFKGSALRGGFGHLFKRLVCVQPTACLQRCTLANHCPYGYIFETSPPEDAGVLRNISEIPRPFIIEPPPDKKMLFIPGETLTFGLTLVGRGIDYLPYFLAVFRELGREGLGRRRGQFRLKAVEAILPGQAAETVYRAEDEVVRTSQLQLTGETIAARAASLILSPTSNPQLTLTFLTPTRLKHQRNWVRRGPAFQALIKVLLGRISSLSYFHCGQPLELDFRGLIDQAAAIETTNCETHWEDWERFSGRQKQRIELGGLVGRVTYQGDLRPYLPFLVLGELVHVGKGAVFGNGRYRIER